MKRPAFQCSLIGKRTLQARTLNKLAEIYEGEAKEKGHRAFAEASHDDQDHPALSTVAVRSIFMPRWIQHVQEPLILN